MTNQSKRDDSYCAALEQIKQILAKYRTDMPHLRGDAVLSPRILTLVIERSESQIPPGVLHRLRPLAEAVLNTSEAGIADMVGSPPPNDVRSKTQLDAEAAYEALAKLYAEVTS